VNRLVVLLPFSLTVDWQVLQTGVNNESFLQNPKIFHTGELPFLADIVSRLSYSTTCFYMAVAAARCVCLCFMIDGNHRLKKIWT